MSRIWEQLFIRPWYERDPELDANGVPIRWADAKIQIKWGSEERGEIDFNSFVTLIQLMQTSGYRLLTEKEIRKNLRKWDLELDSDETVGLFEEQIPKTPVPALPQEMINTLKKKGDLYDMAIEMMKRKRGVN